MGLIEKLEVIPSFALLKSPFFIKYHSDLSPNFINFHRNEK
jgi:hypothetical protein